MRSLYLVAVVLIFISLAAFDKTAKMGVTSPVFQNNGMMPAVYSCEGSGVNPPLNVTNIPKNAKSLALIMHDPDAPMAGGFTHWVVWNLNTTGEIPENFREAAQGFNSTQKQGYIGMCPPSGTHHYHFMVFALDNYLRLYNNTDKATLEKAMEGHIIGKGEIVGLYQKTK